MAFLFSLDEAKSLLEDPFSCFKCITSAKRITLPHYFVGDHRQGAKEFLNLGLKRYSETLDGILITYYDTMILNRNGCIMDDLPYFSFDIRASFIVFRPKVGCTLRGVVNKLSPDHIGCLVHGHFNASIFKTREDEWNSPRIEVGSVVTFEVTSLDLYSKIIFIRGKLLGVHEPDSSRLQENYEADLLKDSKTNSSPSSLRKIKIENESDDDSDVDSSKIVRLDTDRKLKKSPKSARKTDSTKSDDNSNIDCSKFVRLDTDQSTKKSPKSARKSKPDKLAHATVKQRLHFSSESNDSNSAGNTGAVSSSKISHAFASPEKSQTKDVPNQTESTETDTGKKKKSKMEVNKSAETLPISSPKKTKSAAKPPSTSSASDMLAPAAKKTPKKASSKLSKSVKVEAKEGEQTKKDNSSTSKDGLDVGSLEEEEITKIFYQAELENGQKKNTDGSQESPDSKLKEKKKKRDGKDEKKKKKKSSKEGKNSKKKKSSKGKNSSHKSLSEKKRKRQSSEESLPEVKRQKKSKK